MQRHTPQLRDEHSNDENLHTATAAHPLHAPASTTRLLFAPKRSFDRLLGRKDGLSGQFPGAVPTVRAASLSQPPMKTALAFARAA
jgi:hypothetical protein